MSAAKKLSDPDRTLDLVLPESITKTNLKRPSLDDSKIEIKIPAQQSPRPESTGQFKIQTPTQEPQLNKTEDLSNKIKELDEKKSQLEKEISQLKAQKNHSSYDEIKKVTEALIIETKKIAPLEKGLADGIVKIANIKQELQQFFESHLQSGKKGQDLYELQIKEIANQNELVQRSTQLLTEEYHKTVLEIAPLTRQKIDLTNDIASLQSLIALKDNELKILCIQKDDIERIIKNYKEDILSLEIQKKRQDEKLIENKHIEDKLNENKMILNQLINQRDHLELETKAIISNHTELHISGTRLEASLKLISDQVDRKNDQLNTLIKEEIILKQNIEKLKLAEIDLIKSYSQTQNSLLLTQQEIIKLETNRLVTEKMLEDHMTIYKERSEFYTKAIKDLDANFVTKEQEQILVLEKKKFEWEQEFNVFCENKEKELELRIDNLQIERMKKWERERDDFTNQIIESFTTYMQSSGFQSNEDKIKSFKKEIRSITSNFFLKHHIQRSYVTLVLSFSVVIITLGLMFYWKLLK